MFRRLTHKISTDFRNDIPEYSDEQIIEILKQRDHYQAEAAKLAIEEAIKRKIIYSEQDLFAEEYIVEELRFSLFPKIKKTENRFKIRKSIARSLVICGVMPVVYGLLKNNEGKAVEGSLILLLGLLWIFLSAQLIRVYQKIVVLGLFLLSLICFVYIIAKILAMRGFVFFDFFIPGILFLLIVYGLFFMMRNSEDTKT